MARWRRIDYVLLPEAWLPACRETFTGEAGLLALADREDHRLAGATVELRSRCRGWTHRGRPSQTVACNRGALRVPAVAEAIEADPGHADQALAEAGFDKESFDAVLYDIAADPALTKRYLDARE